MCRSCFIALSRPGPNPGPGLEQLHEDERSALSNIDRLRGWSGVFAKSLLLAPFFLWARDSETGAAALQGVIGGDMVTWMLLSLLEWPQRGFQVRLGAIFQIVLLVIFWNRGSLLDVSANANSTSVTAMAFLGVVLLKATAWGAQHSVESSGLSAG